MNDNRSILVVDDELLIRDLLYDFLSGRGWQVQVVDSAEKAMENCTKVKYDIVLTDIKLPDMNGLELTQELKASAPNRPVLLMTGYPSVESAVQGLRLKADDYITKPFNIHSLAKRLESLVASPGLATRQGGQ